MKQKATPPHEQAARPDSAEYQGPAAPTELAEIRELVDEGWRMSRLYRNGHLKTASLAEKRAWADRSADLLHQLASALGSTLPREQTFEQMQRITARNVRLKGGDQE